MSKIIITHSPPLSGTVKVSGAKNSALPILAACLLADGESVIEDIPNLTDIQNMYDLLKWIGLEINPLSNNSVRLRTSKLKNYVAPYELVSKMRASFLVMGPLLARVGRTRISLPGGCAIGTRPIDLHLKGFTAMGAKITQGHGYVEAKARKLKGAKIYLDFPSVGATENILMAACLAEGQTIIENAAVEPEIVDLANFLITMGADIKGAGTDTIKINGVKSLKGCNHIVIPDRIEAGTFMVAAAITKGNIKIDNVVPDHLKPVSAKMREIGVDVKEEDTSIIVSATDKFKPADIKTLPFPGFPTDMQSQFMALMSIIDGTSIIIETIFENRFMHVSELKRMGANIKIEGRSAVIEGIKKLTGAQVKATDLRAGAALVLAGLAAEGETEISDVEHIDRGYCEFEKKLISLGAKMKRIDAE
ncbi:MAG: UDP-N-acetylglucosamine 1-carboxyvinyltransferase [Petroclostridium sp.]|uniref:UDP-N-acetylglucosamine 1-carboxyvinyltransferase n=1 Tax=Petroclostridium xylanilyticum TaxID=1792311 RepID=UPI000B996906|nr:UDP-N-acetylglucosamine 1-carboxyvinyltransferase [Petroclostridium xylanilyticum]MDK2810006.1 UDP-N-acetylglucosamine 1-carboxyvinyltransferase [Petroclostridium sp.]